MSDDLSGDMLAPSWPNLVSKDFTDYTVPLNVFPNFETLLQGMIRLLGHSCLATLSRIYFLGFTLESSLGIGLDFLIGFFDD